MGFSNQERINLFTKALAAGVYDGNATAVWYESNFPFRFTLDGTAVWTQLSSVPAAGNLTTARNNAIAHPTIIEDLSANADAVRLTLVAGTNNSTYAAYSTYNNTASAVLKNWLLPQLVQKSDGSASNGYAINLYDGDPAGSGSLVSTSDGTTGTGENKTVGWIFNYASGILILAEDFKSNISDPYIVGFRYIGNTANTGGSSGAAGTIENEYTADETIATGEVVRLVLSTDGGGLTQGRAIKAEADSLAGSDFLGIAKAGASQGATFSVITEGKIAVKFGSNPATTDNGKRVYLSTTSGQATLTAPSSGGDTVVLLGFLTGATGSTSTPTVSLRIQSIVTLG